MLGFCPFLLTSFCAPASAVAEAKAPALDPPMRLCFASDKPLGLELVQAQREFHEVIKPLADLISKGEGDYNAVNRGYAGDTPGGIQGLKGLTFENFTVGQVMEMQRTQLYAVGRYQFIPVTLRFAVAMSDVDKLDMFTPEVQDKLFAALIQFKRPAVAAYIRGDHDHLGWALNELSKEWASVEYKNGRGYYNHIGGNRAHISRAATKEVLTQVRSVYK